MDAIEDIAFSCSGGWFKYINCLLFWNFLNIVGFSFLLWLLYLFIINANLLLRSE
jgi:hypothetical protein